MNNVTDLDQHKASRSDGHKTSSRDLEEAVSIERIVASLDDNQQGASWSEKLRNSHSTAKQKHGWMEGATKTGKVPVSLSTGSPETDAAGIALTVNASADMCVFDIAVFKTTIELFNSLLVGLDEVQRERVLEHLDKNAATALLMLDYSEKLKAAALGPMVDAALRARG